MTSTLLPNTFQTPNDYIDQALELLTSEEFKCLMFAVRHIYGWQDKIGSRRSCISFTMFEHGIPTNSDKHYGGTGLARVAIQKALDALDHYKLLIKQGAPTTKGQEYEIGVEPDWEGLRQREADRLEMNRLRTEKARKNRKPKKVKPTETKDVARSQTNHRLVELTDYTQLDGLTSSQLDTLTDGRLDGLTESNPSLQTQSNKDIAAPQNGADELPEIKIIKRSEMFVAVAGGIFEIFDTTALDKKLVVLVNKVVRWLRENSPGAKPETIKAFSGWYKNKFPGAALPQDETKFAKHFMAFKQQHLNHQNGSKSAPPAVPAPVHLTDDEKQQRREMREAAQADLLGAG